MPQPASLMFSVVPPSRGGPDVNNKHQIVLMQDKWNDFKYRTQYQLYVASTESTYEFIGNVKILKRGQKADFVPSIEKDFVELDGSFYSLGQSLDYYQRLGDLSAEIRNHILVSLRDVIYRPELEPEIEEETGWQTSVLRDFKDDRNFRSLARSVLTGNFSQLANVHEGFEFQVPNWNKALKFEFSAPSVSFWGPFRQPLNPVLPDRLIVLVGRNSSGKSTLLSRLARVAHAGRTERSSTIIKSLGEFNPQGLGFPRIITISYSAFDSFQIPGIRKKDRDQIARDVDKGEGRFVFCGLRDIAAELRERTNNVDSEVLASGAGQANDRVERTLLKSIEKLADEFLTTIKRIERLKREAQLDSALNTLLKDASFNDVREDFIENIKGDNARQMFLSWSTGHKIAIQTIASLVAYTEPRSLILYDEPETHLHPPLLAALMHAVREALRIHDAFGVIATHSPVVLQETMAQHVYIVRREGDTTDVSKPSIETFGESVGALTELVFGLTSDITDFHSVLRGVVREKKTIDEVEDLFRLHGLSTQARAYVMSIFAANNRQS